MINNTNKVSIHWKGLDVLWGLAAILMLAKHRGYEALTLNQIDGSLSGNLLSISLVVFSKNLTRFCYAFCLCLARYS